MATCATTWLVESVLDLKGSGLARYHGAVQDGLGHSVTIVAASGEAIADAKAAAGRASKYDGLIIGIPFEGKTTGIRSSVFSCDDMNEGIYSFLFTGTCIAATLTGVFRPISGNYVEFIICNRRNVEVRRLVRPLLELAEAARQNGRSTKACKRYLPTMYL